MDKIKISILEDGTLKIETDEISMANHTNAEGLILDLITRMGGEVERQDKGHGHSHEHNGVFHTH